jgi:ribosomal protein S18 acetylase RimI-like enzyme
MVRVSIKKIGLGLGIGAALAGGIWYYAAPRASYTIADYNPATDKAPILAIFDKDWYWLVASPREEYSVEFMLDYRAPDPNPLYLGAMRIKVLREGNAFVGFVAYYIERVGVGKVLFLAVNDEFRGKRYGQKLLEYAIGDFASMGIKKVVLVTRIANTMSRPLYERIGFYEVRRDDEGFIYYEYDIR